MCGIFGYIGDREARPILIDGLKLLEYRGYDSAGIAVLEEDDIEVVKREGKIAKLEEKVQDSDISGSVGISHTRWATHGMVNDSNAHPHTDCKHEISIVHNGIIENSSEIRLFLEKHGHRFKSDTDSEVIAHLLEHLYEGSLEKSMISAIDELEGSFAVAAVKAGSNRIVAARRGSPLVVGLGESENFIASDTAPFLKHTNKVNYLEEDQIVVLEKDGFRVLDLDGEEVEVRVKELDESFEDVQLGEYDTFMRKEIYDQPEILKNNLNLLRDGEVHFPNLSVGRDYFESLDRIILTACGTSWHSCLVAEYVFESLLDIPVEVEYASEFRYRDAPLGRRDLVVGVSQSGETADTLAALRRAKEEGARTLGVINVPGSTMTREVDDVIYIRAGKEIGVASTKAFTGQILALNLLALLVGDFLDEMDSEEKRCLVDAMKVLPEQIREILDREDYIEELAEEYNRNDDLSNALFMGRGINFPTALEGALKLKEISYVHAEGYPAAEMKHGPIALIDEDMPSVFIANDDNGLYRKVLSNMEEVKARGGRIIAVTDKDDDDLGRVADHVIRVPKTHRCLSPVLNAIPLQLLSYHIATLRGLDVDKPRNLAKSVTVE